MGYVLLAIEHLAFWWSAAALVTAWGARIPGRWRRLGLIACVLVLPLSAITIGSAALLALTPTNFPTGPFRAWIVVLALALLGAMAIGFMGLRRKADGELTGRRWRYDLLAFLAGGVVLVHLMTFWNLDLAARQQIESIRVESGALAVSLAPPVVPDRDNAAVLYQEVFDSGLLDKPPQKYEAWCATVTKNPADLPVKDSEFIAYMQRHATLANRIGQATELSVCNFRRDWGRPNLGMLIPETQNLRSCARELVLSAHYRASQGELGLALQDLLAAHRLADHAGQEPILVSLLVSLAIDNLAVNSLEYLLQTYPATAQDIAQLDAWRPTPSSIRYQRALRMEEAFGLATFCQIANLDDGIKILEPLEVHHWPAMLAPVYRVFLITEDLQSYRQYMTRSQNSAVASYRARSQVSKDLDQELREKPAGIVTRLLLPAPLQVQDAVGYADANQRLAQLAIAMHAYRLQHGDFPTALAELDRHILVPRDPFNDEPLRMVRHVDTVVLYSVGPNLTDDLGMKGESDRFPRLEGDLTFILKVPRLEVGKKGE